MIGVIGGTGLYELDNLEDVQEVDVESPFGKTEVRLTMGCLDGVKLVFLARHGKGHRLPPSLVNYRSNIDALKRAGVDRLIAFNAVGSLKDELTPGDFVIVNQYIDRTSCRERSFFGEGLVAHVGMAKPTCATMGNEIFRASEKVGVSSKMGGTSLVIEGPQFSTLAESQLYRSWGADVIGMTAMPEARLAREAEICYASVALVTDYDCWHPQQGVVATKTVLDTLRANTKQAKSLLQAAVPLISNLEHPCSSGCSRALENAIATSESWRDPKVQNRLSAVAGRVLKRRGWDASA